MLRIKKKYAFIIFILIMLFTRPSNADDEIEDLIDIFELNSKLIAVIEGKKTISFNLPVREKVLSSDSKGYLGTFLTNNRFYVISTTSSGWRYFHLRSDEAEEAIISLSPTIALLACQDRAIGYVASSNNFIQTQIPLKDEILFVRTDKYIAVIITSSKALGFSKNASFFTEVRLRNRESLEDVKMTSNKVTVLTSDRLLSFNSESTAWNEQGLY